MGICSALVDPAKYGLIQDTLSISMRRTLITVSKVLQGLANGVEYDGKKEAFMVVFNTIIRRNLHAMRKYLDILASPPEFFSQHEMATKVVEYLQASSLSTLMSILNEHQLVLR